MIFRTGRIAALRWRSVRHAALLILSLAVAHEAIYWSQGQTSLVPQDGAHGYWPAMLGMAAVGALLLSAWSIWRVGKSALADPVVPLTQPATFVREWRAIVGRLLPAVALLYLVLENAEHIIADGHAEGIDVYLTPSQILSFPILVGVVALIGAVGAIVRWHEAVIARYALRRRSRPRGHRPAAMRTIWFERAELARNARLRVRQDLGRAPPIASA